MSWRIENVESQRGRFVLKALEEGANKSELCREAAISRPTGYKWIKRYKAKGIRGLEDENRRPKNLSNVTSSEVVIEIVRLRTEHPSWGSRKIRKILLREKVLKKRQVPCKRTIDRILKRCELVTTPRRRKRSKLPDIKVIKPEKPNDVWTIDFKGWWYTKDRKKCFPLTVRDEKSRFIIGIFALRDMTYKAVKECLIVCFTKYGLPLYIRSDNGQPFISTRALCGLTKLSTWWLSLGITPNRIPLASPDKNGGHERMHKDIKRELQQNPAQNSLSEQKRFDRWTQDFNYIRPHEALDDDVPAKHYKRSPRKYPMRKLPYQYPVDYELRKVSSIGTITWQCKVIKLSKALAGETIGIETVDADTLRLWYTDYCLGVSDLEFKTPIVSALAPLKRGAIAEGT